jgi:glycogen debranching enzyme
MMYSEEFLTVAGLRSRGRRHWNLFGRDLWEYQGSRVTWAVMTNVFARGLRRQGMRALARDMENRLLNAAGISGTLAEFYYVDLEGRVAYDPKALYTRGPQVIAGTNVPEQTQAWTVSALLRAILAQQGERPAIPNPLERELLSPGPTPRLRGRDLKAAFPTDHAFRVDREQGRAIEQQILANSPLGAEATPQVE